MTGERIPPGDDNLTEMVFCSTNVQQVNSCPVCRASLATGVLIGCLPSHGAGREKGALPGGGRRMRYPASTLHSTDFQKAENLPVIYKGLRGGRTYLAWPIDYIAVWK